MDVSSAAQCSSFLWSLQPMRTSMSGAFEEETSDDPHDTAGLRAQAGDDEPGTSSARRPAILHVMACLSAHNTTTLAEGCACEGRVELINSFALYAGGRRLTVLHSAERLIATDGAAAWREPCGVNGTAHAVAVDATGRFELCGTEDGSAAVVRLSIGTRRHEKPDPDPQLDAVSTELVAVDPVDGCAVLAAQTGTLSVFAIDGGAERFTGGLQLGPDGEPIEEISAIGFCLGDASLLVATGTTVHVVANGPGPS
jgi:hypothetical protein